MRYLVLLIIFCIEANASPLFDEFFILHKTTEEIRACSSQSQIFKNFDFLKETEVFDISGYFGLQALGATEVRGSLLPARNLSLLVNSRNAIARHKNNEMNLINKLQQFYINNGISTFSYMGETLFNNVDGNGIDVKISREQNSVYSLIVTMSFRDIACLNNSADISIGFEQIEEMANKITFQPVSIAGLSNEEIKKALSSSGLQILRALDYVGFEESKINKLQALERLNAEIETLGASSHWVSEFVSSTFYLAFGEKSFQPRKELLEKENIVESDIVLLSLIEYKELIEQNEF